MKLFLFVLVVVLVFNYSEGSRRWKISRDRERIRRIRWCRGRGENSCYNHCLAFGYQNGGVCDSALLCNCGGGNYLRSREKRDTTCAFGGRSFCNVKCKALGKASGDCAWNTETGAFDCECSKEERGIRCNLGGENTCHYTCLALGYQNGVCDSDFNCNCGGGNNRWGDVIQNVGDRL